MTELGFGEDVYKLAMLSYRQREELIDKICHLPGHKLQLSEFFKVIDSVKLLCFTIFSYIRKR